LPLYTRRASPKKLGKIVAFRHHSRVDAPAPPACAGRGGRPFIAEAPTRGGPAVDVACAWPPPLCVGRHFVAASPRAASGDAAPFVVPRLALLEAASPTRMRGAPPMPSAGGGTWRPVLAVLFQASTPLGAPKGRPAAAMRPQSLIIYGPFQIDLPIYAFSIYIL
jgi:hypothetical protein